MAIPNLVQCDKRGQIVIPKEVRDKLGISESADFDLFSVGDGLLLKVRK